MRKGEVVEITNEEDDSLKPLALKETINGFVAKSLPKNYPYATNFVKEGRDKGAVIVSGRREAQEIAARARAAGENLSFDY